MKKILFTLALIIIFSVVAPLTAAAQTYAFSLDTEIVHVYWESDGSLSLSYELTFTNATFADPIDFVDIGIPNNNYNLSNISAFINGVPISHIAYSPYVSYGVEVGLGSNSIQPGRTGTVIVFISNITNVLFEDSDDGNYASAVFSPTWFDSDFVSGQTDLTVVYHPPKGVLPDEPKYHQAPSGFSAEPFSGLDEQGRIIYVWENPGANGHTQYLFGASFPKSYVPADTITVPTIWQRLGIDPEDLLGFLMCAGAAAFIIGIPVISIISTKRRKLKYLPPKISIAGHGIKRGLSAIEAGILLEQPMDKILMMILFACIKKEAAVVETKDPLKLTLIDPPPQKLRPYEVDFLGAMEKQKKPRRKELQKTMLKLVKSVTRKMKGFSKRETVTYYKSIMEKAWAQVEKADTPEMRGEIYDDVMQWTMLDKKYDDRTKEVFQNRPIITPIWWPRYDPVYRSPSTPSKPSGPTMKPTPGGSGLPNLPGSDFAASVVNGVQGFSAGVVGNITDFTNGITKTTNPPPKPSSSYRGSGGGGGGSSCACACACAGCACACAGGGR